MSGAQAEQSIKEASCLDAVSLVRDCGDVIDSKTQISSEMECVTAILFSMSTKYLENRTIYCLVRGWCHKLSILKDEARRPALSTQVQQEGGASETWLYF